MRSYSTHKLMAFDFGDVWFDRLVLVRGWWNCTPLFCKWSTQFVCPGLHLNIFLKVLFIGVMSCMYVLWDVFGKYHASTFSSTRSIGGLSDDTLARKVNTSDASEFARVCGCCPSRGVYSSSCILIISLRPLLQFGDSSGWS